MHPPKPIAKLVSANGVWTMKQKGYRVIENFKTWLSMSFTTISRRKPSRDSWNTGKRNYHTLPRIRSTGISRVRMGDGSNTTGARLNAGEEEKSLVPNHGRIECSSTNDPSISMLVCVSGTAREISLFPVRAGKESSWLFLIASYAPHSWNKSWNFPSETSPELVYALRVATRNGKAWPPITIFCFSTTRNWSESSASRFTFASPATCGKSHLLRM